MPVSPAWTFGPFRLDAHMATLWRGTEPIALRPKDFALLRYLVEHAGQLLTKETLLAAVWPGVFVTDDVLKGAIARLRRALQDDSRAPQWIATAARQGYRFLGTPGMLQSIGPGPVATAPVGIAPLLVGRAAEVQQLHQWWQRAQAGQRQMVFVTSEAGIGKTTVVETFVAQVATAGQGRVAHGQCVEHYGVGEPYGPLLEALDRLGRGPQRAQLVEHLRRQAPTWLVQLPGLLDPDEATLLQQHLVGTTTARMLRELAGVLEALTAQTPLVLVLEDLHWSDASTLDALMVLAQRREAARLLILATYRPTGLLEKSQPLPTLVARLQQQRQAVELSLPLLDAAAVAAYLMARWPGRTLSPALTCWLHERTEGQPLFLVTLADYLDAQGGHPAEDHPTREPQWQMLARTIPETLRQTIASQLLQLPPAAQQVLEAASVAGIAWSAATVAAALTADVVQMEGQCEALAQRGTFLDRQSPVVWPDGTVATGYCFRHALYQQVVYERLPVAQRQQWHQRIGARLETAYGEQVGEIAAELAMHWQQGWDTAQAVRYRQQATEQALRRYAYREAIDHVTTALALLMTLPDTPERTRHELSLQLTLGSALTATQGFAAPEVGDAYARARALCAQMEESPRLFPALLGLWRFAFVRAEYRMARALGEQCLSLAQRLPSPSRFLGAHQALGSTLVLAGEPAAARAHLEQALALYTHQQPRHGAYRTGLDAGVVCDGSLALALWFLGYPDQAVQRLQEGSALAQKLAHPFSSGAMLFYAGPVYQLRREVQAVHTCAEALVALASEHEFALWLAAGMVAQGWVLAAHGQTADGILRMRQGLAAYTATGAVSGRSKALTGIAAAYGQSGQSAAGLAVLAEALTLVEATGEEWVAAELYRLQGELLWQAQHHRGEAADAERCMQHALVIARRQQSRSLELRAAMSLSRLWQQQGKRDAARQLLAEVYQWFTEGFDTADLQDARTLLHALGGAPVPGHDAVPLAHP